MSKDIEQYLLKIGLVCAGIVFGVILVMEWRLTIKEISNNNLRRENNE